MRRVISWRAAFICVGITRIHVHAFTTQLAHWLYAVVRSHTQDCAGMRSHTQARWGVDSIFSTCGVSLRKAAQGCVRLRMAAYGCVLRRSYFCVCQTNDYGSRGQRRMPKHRATEVYVKNIVSVSDILVSKDNPSIRKYHLSNVRCHGIWYGLENQFCSVLFI